MSKQDRFSVQWPMRLDCGHLAKPGDKVIVTKIYTCENHIQQPLHATLTAIKQTLENGVVHLKNLEWDLRHAEQK